jgi:hypothetical protein
MHGMAECSDMSIVSEWGNGQLRHSLEITPSPYDEQWETGCLKVTWPA